MAAGKEAQARVKINKLLEAAGWCFFDDAKGKANVALEPNVKLTHDQIDDLGENFESTRNGFVDFLLLNDRGFPLVVLDAIEACLACDLGEFAASPFQVEVQGLMQVLKTRGEE